MYCSGLGRALGKGADSVIAFAMQLDALLSYGVDLTSVLGTTDAFVGFTSGTGAAYGNHDVLAWQFNSTFDPIDDIGDVPEPGILILLGLGLTSLGLRRRKRAF